MKDTVIRTELTSIVDKAYIETYWLEVCVTKYMQNFQESFWQLKLFSCVSISCFLPLDVVWTKNSSIKRSNAIRVSYSLWDWKEKIVNEVMGGPHNLFFWVEIKSKFTIFIM